MCCISIPRARSALVATHLRAVPEPADPYPSLQRSLASSLQSTPHPSSKRYKNTMPAAAMQVGGLQASSVLHKGPLGSRNHAVPFNSTSKRQTLKCGLHLPARPSWVPHASADMSSSLFGGNLLMDRPKEEQVAKQSTAAAVQEALWGADLVLPAAVSVAAAVAAMFGADDTSASLATISATPAAAAALSALATLAATASTAAPPPARSPAAAAAAAASAASSVSVVERPVETAAAAAEEENAAPGPEPPTPQDPTPTPAAAAATAAATEASPGANMSWWQRWASDTKALQTKLQSLGLAGVVAYGLFNTLYYTGMFLFVWFYVAQVPAGLGVAAASAKFLEVFALVWAGSQVTKLARAGAALALAPVVDAGLDRLQAGLGLGSKRQAFLVVVAGCLGLAAALFGGVVMLAA